MPHPVRSQSWASAALAAALLSPGPIARASTPPDAASFPTPADVQLGGLLGEALRENQAGRLSHFIVDEHSPAAALFSAEGRAGNTAGVYWGEHAGKWLYATARAAKRSKDPVLTARVQAMAHFFVRQQEADGYLGTYPEPLRFMHPQTNAKRQWDLWTMSCMMLGLLEVNRYFPDPAYLLACDRIVDLCATTFAQGTVKITDCGNHHGLSATVMLDPVADLYLQTKDPKVLAFARSIYAATLAKSETNLESGDLQAIGDGKIYQLCWNLVGVAKLYRATGDAGYLKLVERDWESIRKGHLTVTGGPWGGVGVPREEFDPGEFFSPYGYVETCSTMMWLQMNRELLRITGESRYADEIERSAYNALLGAQDPNGEDWCYYTFANGERMNTGYWSCCKSSGALALEELPALACDLREDGRAVAIEQYGPSHSRLMTASGEVTLDQVTRYPFDGSITITVHAASEFPLLLRIPGWCKDATFAVNDGAPTQAKAGTYLRVSRRWQDGDRLALRFPMTPFVVTATNSSLHGVYAERARKPNYLEVTHYDYAALQRGPLVYATGLIDGFKREDTLRWPPDGDSRQALKEAPPPAGSDGIALTWSTRGREPILFLPYYEAGGRTDHAWRLTWMQVASD